jgi:hypothetical protein
VFHYPAAVGGNGLKVLGINIHQHDLAFAKLLEGHDIIKRNGPETASCPNKYDLQDRLSLGQRFIVTIL